MQSPFDGRRTPRWFSPASKGAPSERRNDGRFPHPRPDRRRRCRRARSSPRAAVVRRRRSSSACEARRSRRPSSGTDLSPSRSRSAVATSAISTCRTRSGRRCVVLARRDRVRRHGTGSSPTPLRLRSRTTSCLLACGTLPQPLRYPAHSRSAARPTRASPRTPAREAGPPGTVRRVVFAVPAGRGLEPCPAYELALLTAAHLAAHKVLRESTLDPWSRPRNAPLGPLRAGRRARQLPRCSPEEGRDRVHDRRVYPARDAGGTSFCSYGGRSLPADRVVAHAPSPEVHASGASRRRSTASFPVDEHGRVTGLRDVYAAGDITDFSQSSRAASQPSRPTPPRGRSPTAAGAYVTPEAVPPGTFAAVLLTGYRPRYIRDGWRPRERERFDREPRSRIWWPPAKIDGPVPGAVSSLGIADDAEAARARPTRTASSMEEGRTRAPPTREPDRPRLDRPRRSHDAIADDTPLRGRRPKVEAA